MKIRRSVGFTTEQVSGESVWAPKQWSTRILSSNLLIITSRTQHRIFNFLLCICRNYYFNDFQLIIARQLYAIIKICTWNSACFCASITPNLQQPPLLNAASLPPLYSPSSHSILNRTYEKICRVATVLIRRSYIRKEQNMQPGSLVSSTRDTENIRRGRTRIFQKHLKSSLSGIIHLVVV